MPAFGAIAVIQDKSNSIWFKKVIAYGISKTKENSITTVIMPDQIEKADISLEINGRYFSSKYKEGDQKIIWINALNPASFN